MISDIHKCSPLRNWSKSKEK